MEINLTLFVQIGNFFVAYMLVRILFLRPALCLLRQDEQHRSNAQAQLQQHELQLLKQRNLLQVEWNAYRKYCRAAVLHTVEVAKAGASQEGGVACAVPSITLEQTEQLASDLEQRITTKVSHVRA